MTERPSRDEALMMSAKVWAKRSTCSRASVGVVIARDGRILVTGYNGAPAGMPHCFHAGMDITSDSRGGCAVAVHAEANAVAYAARYGVRLEGAELFTTYTPCLNCSMLIINSGLTRVVGSRPYRDPAGWDLLRDAGIDAMMLTVVE